VASKKDSNGALSKVENFFTFDLSALKSNAYQSRGDGAIAPLNAVGVGLFDPIPTPKGLDKKDIEAFANWPKVKIKDSKDKEIECLKPIWPMLVEKVPEQWALAIAAIEEYQHDITDLAATFTVGPQLQNIGITPYVDDDGKKHLGFFTVVMGMRRCLAKAYLYAKSTGEVPLLLKAELQDTTDPIELHVRSMTENKARLQETPVQEGKKYQQMKSYGLNVNQIAEKEATNPQNVRNRLALMRCTQEERDKVHAGKMGMMNALKALQKRESGKDTAATPAEIPENRKRMPTLRQATALYGAVEQPEGVTKEEFDLWMKDDVRKFVAFYLGVDFITYKDMKRKKAEAEKASLDAEAARKAAEASDQEEAADTKPKALAAAK